MSRSIEIPAQFLKEAREICRPEVECPALLFGRENVVETWRWAENKAASSHAFIIDPEEMYRYLKEAEELGLQLLAIFHTHPGTPAPSARDLRYMQLWRVVWIIADIYTWQITAWTLDNELQRVTAATRD